MAPSQHPVPTGRMNEREKREEGRERRERERRPVNTAHQHICSSCTDLQPAPVSPPTIVNPHPQPRQCYFFLSSLLARLLPTPQRGSEQSQRAKWKRQPSRTRPPPPSPLCPESQHAPPSPRRLEPAVPGKVLVTPVVSAIISSTLLFSQHVCPQALRAKSPMSIMSSFTAAYSACLCQSPLHT